MVKIAEWMMLAINNYKDEAFLRKLKGEVIEFSLNFKLPSDLR